MTGYVLDPGEIVKQKVNRSLFDLLPLIMSCTLIAIVAIGIMLYEIRLTEIFPVLTPEILFSTAAALLALVLLMLMTGLYVYDHNYLLVTNMHIIKLQQIGLFAQQTSQLNLARIEDVRGGRRGILGTMFNFGDVEVQTAGEAENFLFKNAPNPQLLADQLLQCHDEFMKSHPGQSH